MRTETGIALIAYDGSDDAAAAIRHAGHLLAPRPAVAFDKDDPDTWGKVGRNEPCPCGSGKKYKKCCGR